MVKYSYNVVIKTQPPVREKITTFQSLLLKVSLTLVEPYFNNGTFLFSFNQLLLVLKGTYLITE